MIEGKVAQVLSTRELIINVGREAGVVMGMKFAVLAESPLQVRDPDTNELLGEIDREKVRVQASEVQQRFTICRTYQTRSIPGSGTNLLGLGLFRDFEYRPARTVPVTLKAEDSALPAPLSDSESYVKTNDRVRQIEPEQEP